jgi:UPF0755 protein
MLEVYILKKNAEEGKVIKKKNYNWVLNLGVICVILFGFFSYAYTINLFGIKGSPQYIIKQGEGQDVDIPKGASTSQIAEALYKAKLINYPKVFKFLSKMSGYDGLYKSGVHTLSKKMNYEQMMKAITKNPKSYTLTIPEGFNTKQILDAFVAKNLAAKQDIEDLLMGNGMDYKFLEKVPARKYRLEGYLFPDTYFFGIYEAPDSMIRKMLDNFNLKFKPEYYKRAEELKYTVDQIITMASIIEKEAYLKEEKKIIAGVFYNRLKSKDMRSMKLQSCATIEYILFMKNGVTKEKLTDKDTKIDDPYNTYAFPGLPPGPICSPGLDSILAALYPEKTDYLYFVAKPDKSHAFSKSYSEHLENVKKYGG